MKEKEQSLDNLVSKQHLEHSGFRHKKGIMYRTIHDQEIRFIEVRDGLYSWAGVHYVGRTISNESDKEWRDYMDGRFDKL